MTPVTQTPVTQSVGTFGCGRHLYAFHMGAYVQCRAPRFLIMLTIKKLRAALLIISTLTATGLIARATETDCSCEETATPENTKAKTDADSDAISAGRIGKQYVETRANLTKRNHDRPTSISYGLEYNQPISANFDASAFYSYSYFQDFRFSYLNTLGAAATYYKSCGQLKPYVTASLGHHWSSLEDAVWGVNARFGVEYTPAENLVIQTSAGAGRILKSGNDTVFSGDASATYWLFPHVGLHTRLDWFEYGLFNSTCGIVARYSF